jgi:hypothetical protein
MPWDSPLSALADLVTSCADLDVAPESQQAGLRLRLQRAVVSSPLELQTETSPSGEITLAAAPPRQAIETSVMPVLHQLTLVIEVAS